MKNLSIFFVLCSFLCSCSDDNEGIIIDELIMEDTVFLHPNTYDLDEESLIYLEHIGRQSMIFKNDNNQERLFKVPEPIVSPVEKIAYYNFGNVFDEENDVTYNCTIRKKQYSLYNSTFTLTSHPVDHLTFFLYLSPSFYQIEDTEFCDEFEMVDQLYGYISANSDEVYPDSMCQIRFVTSLRGKNNLELPSKYLDYIIYDQIQLQDKIFMDVIHFSKVTSAAVTEIYYNEEIGLVGFLFKEELWVFDRFE